MTDKSMFPIQDIDDVLFAFPARVMHLIPAWEDIPDEFKEHNNLWHKIATNLFYLGAGTKSKFFFKEGVDPEKALRHILTIMKSYEPHHQHKIAGVAFLFSDWFTFVNLMPAEKNEAFE